MAGTPAQQQAVLKLFGKGGTFTPTPAKPAPMPKPTAVPKTSPTVVARVNTGKALQANLAQTRAKAPAVASPVTISPAKPVLKMQPGPPESRSPAPPRAYVSPVVAQRVNAGKTLQTSLAQTRARAPAVATRYAKTQPSLLDVLGKAGQEAATPVNYFVKALKGNVEGTNTGKNANISGAGFLPAHVSPLPQLAAGTAKVVGNLGKDVLNTPASIIPSLANLGYAGVSALQGNLKPIESVGRQTLQGLTPAGIEAHPLNAALIASGALSGVGAVLGKAGDLAGITSAAARYREPEQLVAGLQRYRRPYPRDLYRQLVQRGWEARPAAQAVRLARTRSMEQGPLPAKFSDLFPRVPFGITHRIRREAQADAGAGERVRRIGRTESGGAVLRAVQKARTGVTMLKNTGRNLLHPDESLLRPHIAGKEAIAEIGQRGFTTYKQYQDAMEAKIARLEAMPPHENVEAQLQREDTIARIRATLNDRQFKDNPQPTIDAARSITAYQRGEHTQQLADRGQFTEQAARAAPLVPHAVTPVEEGGMGLVRDIRPTDQMNAHTTYEAALADVEAKTKAELAAYRAGDPAAVAAAKTELMHAQALADQLEVPRPHASQQMEDAFFHPTTGERVPLDAIEKDMSDKGLAKPLFVSHKGGFADIGTGVRKRGTARSMFVSSATHPLAESKFRSGEAYLNGFHDTSFQAVHNQIVSERAKIDAHDARQADLKRISIFNKNRLDPTTDKPAGYWASYDDAMRAKSQGFVKDQNPNNVELVPIRATELFMRSRQAEIIKNDLTPLEEPFSGMNWTDATGRSEADRQAPGPWVLAPKDYVDERLALEARRSQLAKDWQGFTKQFRRSALATSAHRILGLPIENFIFRGIPARAGPVSALTLHHVLEMARSPEFNTPEFATEHGRTGLQWETQFRARALANMVAGQALRERVFAGSRIAELTGKTPIIGNLTKTWATATDAIMKAEAHAFEGSFQAAVAGRAMRQDLHEILGMPFAFVLKHQQAAFEDYVKGLVGSPSEYRFAQIVDRAGGRYKDLSPAGQKTMLATPFGLWYVNALKFTYGTMPVDHPIITGLLAAAVNGTQQERAKQGLLGPLTSGPFQLAAQQQGAIPHFPGAPWPVGSSEQAQYYSPYDPSTDPLGVGASMVVPQLASAFNAAAYGTNFYGAKLTVPGLARGAEVPLIDRAKVVINSLLDSLVPIGKIEQVLVGGRKQYGSSSIFGLQTYAGGKPGSTVGALENLFNPLKVQKNRPASGSPGSSNPLSNQNLGLPSNQDLGIPTNSQLGLP